MSIQEASTHGMKDCPAGQHSTDELHLSDMGNDAEESTHTSACVIGVRNV